MITNFRTLFEKGSNDYIEEHKKNHLKSNDTLSVVPYSDHHKNRIIHLHNFRVSEVNLDAESKKISDDKLKKLERILGTVREELLSKTPRGEKNVQELVDFVECVDKQIWYHVHCVWKSMEKIKNSEKSDIKTLDALKQELHSDQVNLELRIGAAFTVDPKLVYSTDKLAERPDFQQKLDYLYKA